MKIRFIQFFVLSVFSLLLLSSCSDDDDNTVESLSGKYVITKIEASGCSDPEENFSFSGNTSNGVCEEEDGIEVCINICMTFTNGSYTTEYTISGAGFTYTAMDTGTYDPTNSASIICVDGDCGNVEVKNGGDKFVFSGMDSDTGCSIEIEMEKA